MRFPDNGVAIEKMLTTPGQKKVAGTLLSADSFVSIAGLYSLGFTDDGIEAILDRLVKKRVLHSQDNQCCFFREYVDGRIRVDHGFRKDLSKHATDMQMMHYTEKDSSLYSILAEYCHNNNVGFEPPGFYQIFQTGEIEHVIAVADNRVQLVGNRTDRSYVLSALPIKGERKAGLWYNRSLVTLQKFFSTDGKPDNRRIYGLRAGRG